MKKKIIDIEITYWSTKPSNLKWQKNSKKSLHILEDNASDGQVDDSEQTIL